MTPQTSRSEPRARASGPLIVDCRLSIVDCRLAIRCAFVPPCLRASVPLPFVAPWLRGFVAMQRPVQSFNNVEHVLMGKRFEEEQVAGVEVGADRLRIGVDHHGFKAGIAGRKGSVATAVVELDPLPDAVGPSAEDHDFAFVTDPDFVVEQGIADCRLSIPSRLRTSVDCRITDSGKLSFMRRVVVRCPGLELRGARVNELVGGGNVDPTGTIVAGARDAVRDRGKLHIAITEHLGAADTLAVVFRSRILSARAPGAPGFHSARGSQEKVLFLHELTHLLEEPGVNTGELVHLVDAPAHLEGVTDVVGAALARPTEFVT